MHLKERSHREARPQKCAPERAALSGCKRGAGQLLVVCVYTSSSPHMPMCTVRGSVCFMAHKHMYPVDEPLYDRTNVCSHARGDHEHLITHHNQCEALS